MKNNLQIHNKLPKGIMQRILIMPLMLFVLALQAQTRYVTMGGAGSKNGAGWTNAYDSVSFRTALKSASSGTIFWVKAGIYKPANNRDSSFVIASGVKVYGGFIGTETALTQRNIKANITILSGDIGKPVTNTDNCYNVVRFINSSVTTRLDGFSIMHGNASYASGNTNQNSGGGVYIYNNGSGTSSVCSPVIANCIFSYDSAYSEGGGIYINGLTSTSNPTILGCTFAYNVADIGAAIENDDGSPSITDCVFNNNTSNYGCIYNESDDHDILSVVTNCSFFGNIANQYGGAVYNAQGSHNCNLSFYNCIFWNDSAMVSGNEVYDNGCTSTVKYCDIKGSWSGTGNINKDPIFGGINDFRLQTGSPCIDAGSNSYVPTGITTDIAGKARIQNTVVDMGANEGGICITMTNVSITPSINTICSGGQIKLKLLNLANNAGIQWQYGFNTIGNAGTWTNFGTVNKDTATLKNVTATTYVRAVVSNSCTKPSSSTDAVVYTGTAPALSVGNVGPTNATATWTPVLGAITYRLYVNGSLAYKGSSTSYSISGLTPCTKDSMYVKPNISSCGGTAVSSNIVYFNTLFSPLTLNLTQSGNIIKAKWHGGVGSYKLYVGYTTSLNNYTIYSVNDTSYNIVSFQGGQTMIAYVVDQGSTCLTKAQSNYAYLNTSGSNCSSTSPTITAKSSTNNSIYYQWSGTATAYQILYKKASASSWISYQTTSNAYTLSGLASNTCYVMVIANKCTSPSKLSYSTQVDTVCTQLSCSAPVNLIISSLNCHGFTATWNQVAGATDYSAFFTRTSGLGAPTTFSYRYAQNQFVINSLSPGYSYDVYVKANCTYGGQTASSNVESLTMLTTGCKDGFSDNGFNSDNLNNKLSVYPNPSNGYFIVDLNTATKTPFATIQVVNMLGEVLNQSVITNDNGLIHIELNNRNLSSGVYFVRVLIANETHIAKIVIER